MKWFVRASQVQQKWAKMRRTIVGTQAEQVDARDAALLVATAAAAAVVPSPSARSESVAGGARDLRRCAAFVEERTR